jgi:hypothetical protein
MMICQKFERIGSISFRISGKTRGISLKFGQIRQTKSEFVIEIFFLISGGFNKVEKGKKRKKKIKFFTVNIREDGLSPKVESVFGCQPLNPRISGFAAPKTDVPGIPPPGPPLCRERRKIYAAKPEKSLNY